MRAPFTELVIEGPFLLVKGFLLGFRSCSEPRPAYFFHRKAGIRRQTLRDLLSDWLELETLVHLCLEDAAVDRFLAALQSARGTVDLRLRSRRRIMGARFSFSYEVYNRELAAECRSLLEHPPEGVQVSGGQAAETAIAGAPAELSLGYAPEPLWALKGKGEVQGEFAGIAEFYRSCRQSSLAPFLLCGEIELRLAD
jgi:hypothetical protein